MQLTTHIFPANKETNILCLDHTVIGFGSPEIYCTIIAWYIYIYNLVTKPVCPVDQILINDRPPDDKLGRSQETRQMGRFIPQTKFKSTRIFIV